MSFTSQFSEELHIASLHRDGDVPQKIALRNPFCVKLHMLSMKNSYIWLHLLPLKWY